MRVNYLVFTVFTAMITNVSYAICEAEIENTVVIPREYDELKKSDAQRLEQATIRSMQHLMKTQRDLKRKSYSRARKQLFKAKNYASEARQMLPTTLIREKINLANLSLEAEEDVVFYRTLEAISSQLKRSDDFSSKVKKKMQKNILSAQNNAKKGDIISAKKNMLNLSKEIDSLEVDADVIKLVRVSEEVLDLMRQRKFESATKLISNSNLFFVYYSGQLVTPHNDDTGSVSH